MGPGRGTIDPLKEARGASEENAAGRVSQQTQAAELGRDHREELIRQRRERRYREKFNLPNPSYGSSIANAANVEGGENSDADTDDRREEMGEEMGEDADA